MITNEKEVLEDLKETLLFIKEKKLYYGFKKISPVYAFTNEKIKDYTKYFNLKNKNILTVTASGDQVIFSMLEKPNKIDTFDTNKLAYYHLFLKIYAIKALTLEEFENLYNNHDTTLYKKIRDYITKDDIKLYWDNFFKNDDGTFLQSILMAYIKSEYKDESFFYKVKNNVHDNIIYQNIKAKDIPNYYKNKSYDFINLSNIIDYENLNIFIKYLKDIINNNLSTNGKILTSYIWGNQKLENKYVYKELLKSNCKPSIKSIKSDEIIICKK